MRDFRVATDERFWMAVRANTFNSMHSSPEPVFINVVYEELDSVRIDALRDASCEQKPDVHILRVK